MSRFVRRYRWRLLGAASLVGMVAALWCLVRPAKPLPGSLEDVYSRIRVGISQLEAVQALLSCNDTDANYINGTTTQGISFMSLNLKDLPASGDIDHADLEMMDRYGSFIEVTLGKGGIVTRKRFKPSEQLWERLLRVVRQGFGY